MKALVVDDDVVSRMALTDLLKGFRDFDVVECEDGEYAWQALQKGLYPAICCCDISMPRLSGIDLLRRIKSAPVLADMPFVLVSSVSDRSTIQQAIWLGAVGYILKPFKVSEAQPRLEAILKTVFERIAETPAATLKRLNISPARLIAYLGAFEKQVHTQMLELANMQGKFDEAAVKIKIEGLIAGCKTLGLNYAAATLNHARQGRLDKEVLQNALTEVSHTVEEQTQLMRSKMSIK